MYGKHSFNTFHLGLPPHTHTQLPQYASWVGGGGGGGGVDRPQQQQARGRGGTRRTWLATHTDKKNTEQIYRKIT